MIWYDICNNDGEAVLLVFYETCLPRKSLSSECESDHAEFKAKVSVRFLLNKAIMLIS